MNIDRIVVAADESEASRMGIRAALAMGERLRAGITIYHVVAHRPAPALAGFDETREPRPVGAPNGSDAIEQWVTEHVTARPGQPSPAFESGYGLPGIEIPRFAERAMASLLVLGRKVRSPAQRLYEGDTADAVARRSTVPCLFVRRPLGVPGQVLVAVDGTDRGMKVLGFALALATELGSALSGVIVEPERESEPPALARSVLSARTMALQRRLDGAVEPLRVRHGDPAAEILRAAADTEAELIVIGYRRGGPPGPIEGGSVARRVAHAAHCAVLTVPL